MTDTIPSEFAYDVAFSFLKEDEETAQALCDLLEGRFRTFLYSRQQERLAGTDGELSFNDVFARDARTVVVLFRPQWGSTSWTRIEETAIRNRAFTEGYDFATFVQLEEGAEMPKWLPKPRIWMGFSRWGLEGTATVVESRIAESGGIPKVEGALAAAERLQRAAQFEKQRRAFLESQQGVDAARRAIDACFASIKATGKRLETMSPPYSLRVFEEPQRFVLYIERVSVSLALQTQWSNSLDGSTLFLKTWRGALVLHRPVDATLHQEWHMDFDVLASGAHVWRDRSDKSLVLSSEELAEFAVKQVLEYLNTVRGSR